MLISSIAFNMTNAIKPNETTSPTEPRTQGGLSYDGEEDEINNSSFTIAKAAFIAELYANSSSKDFENSFLSIVNNPDVEEVEKETTNYKPKAYIEVQDTKFPQYFQGDYPNTPYGAYGTVASHGCGITCVAMVATYLTDKTYTPDVLAEQFGSYNTAVGSYWSLFEDSAKELGLDFEEETTDWSKVKEALKDGKPVISIQSTGRFTGGGHFICLFGLTDSGKIIVYDPNSYNLIKNSEMIEGFKNGFEDYQITDSGDTYWIYGAKSHVGIMEYNDAENN